MDVLVDSSTEIPQTKNPEVFSLIPAGCGLITDALREKMKTELKEDEESVRNGLKKMRELIRKERLCCQEDDAFLLRFLRVKKYKIPKSFSCLKTYTQIAPTAIRHCGVPDVDAIKKVLRKNICAILPYRDSEGRSVGVFRLGHWNPEICIPGQVYHTVMVILYFAFQDPAVQISGYCGIFDIRVIPYIYIPLFMKYVTVFLSILGGCPGRVRRFDVISDHAVVNIVYRLLKHLIPKKIRERIVFHQTVDTLVNYYEPAILPKEYGGELESLDNEHWIHNVDTIAQKLMSEAQHESST